MKEFWVEIEDFLPENVKNSILTKCKALCSTVLVGRSSIQLAKSLDLKTASKEDNPEAEIRFIDGLIKNQLRELKNKGKKVCIRLTVKDRVDEEKIVEASNDGVDYVIVQCPNWKVIPLENLIAKIHGKTKLLAEVSNVEEAKLALETLELGVNGVALKTDNTENITEVASVLDKIQKKPELKLTQARIVECKQLGLGDRVCVDTCQLMCDGEGILVGCQSSTLFLVQAEVLENPHVEPRPFRVNAGPVSLYVLADTEKTRYLSELKAGETVLIVDRQGNTRSTTVGRIKIEKRPLMLIEAEINGKIVKNIVQNAETIHLVTKEGSKSIRSLKPGDEVIVHHQPGGRHFGILVEEETVIER